MRVPRLAAALAAALAVGCRPSGGAPQLLVVATGGGFDAPATVEAGWHRLRFHQLAGGKGRNLVLFAVPDALDLEAFARALDTALTTPAPATARGGSESPVSPADTTSLVLFLAPGRYVWASMTRAANGRRYVTNGVRREFRVTADSNGADAPRPTATLSLVDFAFVGADTLDEGAHRIRVTNDGRQDHVLVLHRLGEGVSFAEWLSEDGAPSTRMGGVSRLGPDQEVFLDVTLTPGRYAAVCLIPDPASGRPHTELGMVREIVVTER
ncbi:MAG TPA: hypothetical protein VLA95_11115 [Gemmatimonadales bacterium]|nr:hypothetical protein [Gemmatimonadales bacterium]